MKKNIAIIGSWFWGLSAACYLAKAWYNVTVYEKNEQLWGRASTKKANWFTRDMWPSWYLMPDLFEQFFSDFDKKIEDYLTLTKLDPSYRIYFKDDTKTPYIDVSSTLEKNRELFENIEPGSMKSLKEYLAKSEVQYHIGMDEFVQKNYDSIFDFFNKRMMIDGMKMNVYSTIWTYVKKYFKTDKMQKIIQYPMIFLWSPPYETPALYNLMSYVDFGMWVRYPQGGMSSLVNALVSLWTELWVQYKTNSEVTRIQTTPLPKTWKRRKRKSKISSLTLISWETIEVDDIVSNADMHWTETQLLESENQTYNEKYRGNHTLAPSWFCMYIWLDKKVTWLNHHTLIFNQDWDQNNKEVFKSKVFPTDPSYYICCPSKTDNNVAPGWHENLFFLVPFPSRVNMNEEQKKSYKDKLIATTEKILWEKIEWHIIHEELFWPDEFTSRYHAYGWNALSWWAHTFRQTAIFRPNNVSKKVEGLYYAWWYTNPGIGVPICIISGKLASMRIKDET